MKKYQRVLAGVILTPIVIIGLSTLIYESRKNHFTPEENQELARIEKIGKSLPAHCPTWRDSLNIPHIQAESDLHAWACLGLTHARDRGWQLQFYRRAAQGTLAEVLGASSLKSDFGIRLLRLTERIPVTGAADFALSPLGPDLSTNLLVRGMDAVDRKKPDWRNFFSIYGEGQIDLRTVDFLTVKDTATRGVDVLVALGWPGSVDLVQRPLAQSRLIICASPAYWAAHGKPARVSELARHNCLGAGI